MAAPDGVDAAVTAAVPMVTAPLDDAALAPDAITTAPPVRPVTAVVLPAWMVMLPPDPELVGPTRREMGPPAPPAACPVANTKEPPLPAPAEPVLRNRAPDDPEVEVEPEVI